jgi:RNA polymerase sigma-70 factor (ECF subfamily)
MITSPCRNGDAGQLVPWERSAQVPRFANVGPAFPGEVAWYEGTAVRRDDVDRSLADQALAHADALYNLARYLTGSDTESEDLLQETYTRAMTGAPSFDGRNLKAWLFRILRNAFVDLYRKRKVRERALEAFPDVDGLLDADLLHGDVEVEQLRHALASDLESAMMSLSEDARMVVLLDLEGMTEVESAAILGCAVGTVKSRLSRARLILRRRLVEYGK